MTALRFRATILPVGTAPVDVWVSEGRITFEPQPNAEPLDGAARFVLPGLVDCHTHVTLDFGGTGLPIGSAAIVKENLARNLRSGVLLVRDIGAIGRETLRAREGPRLHAAGRWLAPEGRFIPDWHEPAPPEELLDAVRGEVAAGVRWVKLVGDWWGEDDFVESYEPELLTAAVRTAKGAGARVAVHAMGYEAAAAAIEAGVDSVEHGTQADEALVEAMGARGVAWTPTLSTMVPAVRSGGEDVPPGTKKMREWVQALPALFAAARRAGVTVLAGGDIIAPGTIWREVAMLAECGLDPAEALAAASSTARAFLGEPGIEEGAPADLVFYRSDPRDDPYVLADPALVLFEGRPVAGTSG